jgi:phosphotriesterase-related protein
MILPHEHVFVDLRTPEIPGHAQADPAAVTALMGKELETARRAGISVIVECTPVGVGRRVDILLQVARAANFPLMVPTGVYRQPWVPEWVRAASEMELTGWMRQELEEGIEGSGVRAGFIKLSAGDDGLTEVEARILGAAGRASAAGSASSAEGANTNAVDDASHAWAAIGSHTIRGRVVADQLAVLAECGFPAERFIWIHAQVETDFRWNLELARRGVWIELDGIGSDNNDAFFIERIQRLRAEGLQDRILLSQDRGWFDPAQPGGGTPKPYTYLVERFLPQLAQNGLSPEDIWAMVHTNPFRAFAR